MISILVYNSCIHLIFLCVLVLSVHPSTVFVYLAGDYSNFIDKQIYLGHIGWQFFCYCFIQVFEFPITQEKDVPHVPGKLLRH